VKHIKNINEYFDTGVFGDTYGYGGANGVLKINYKPFSDLSIEVGPDSNVPRNIKGAQFQIGDMVIAQPINSKNKKNRKIGIIVRAERSENNKSFRYFIQVFNIGKLTEKVIEVKPDAIEFINNGDKGHIELLSKYKLANVKPDSFNSTSVYSNPRLGELP
jgi:hypothetical protein